ncbi:MAG: VCBS repeat-containing protein [Bacteroidetes bacterium]|nr:VCBS repeat-containing protein [Bacteroidota bacterium]
MKNTIKYQILVVTLLVSLSATGQQFTEITGTPPTNQPSDSRSVNIIDLNGDGWDDIFITNGQQPGTVNMLYSNNGNGTFTTVTGDPIVSNAAPFDGATFGDVDNDGDADAFAVTWYGQLNYFYRNNGNGTFNHEPQNVTGTIGTYSETAAWGDYNNDGSIDLYITNSDGNKKYAVSE